MVYAVIDVLDDGNSLLAALSQDSRQALFISIAGTTGALLGFAIAGVTIVLSVGQGPRMEWLKKQSTFRQEVRFLFFSAILGLAFSTVVFLTLIAVGIEHLSLGWACLAAAAVALTLDRLWRLTKFLNQLMGIALEDSMASGPPNPPFSEPRDQV